MFIPRAALPASEVYNGDIYLHPLYLYLHSTPTKFNETWTPAQPEFLTWEVVSSFVHYQVLQYRPFNKIPEKLAQARFLI